MKVDCELTQEEEDAVCLLMGMGTGAAIGQFGQVEIAKAGIKALNKLFSRNPNYQPYDENSYDPKMPGMPFKRLTRQ